MLFLSVATWLTFPSANLKVYNIPSTIQNGTSTAVFTSAASGFDAPKVQPINGSVFDWWYFDVVSTDPSVTAFRSRIGRPYRAVCRRLLNRAVQSPVDLPSADLDLSP
ncbi:hypothetical protein K438DRAFT_2003179 [Mycena galopus ATCC 62051]|nr:hypothetical protein K438DRAFT_2003179 [Mycena galopus ATCC 62051]